MADFLLTTFEGGGNIPPVLGMIRRLRARGHTVRALGDAVLGPEMEAAGATFRPWTTAPNRPDRRAETDPIRDWASAEPGASLLCGLDTIMVGQAAAYAADTAAELRRAPADALLCSDLLFGPPIAGEAAGTDRLSARVRSVKRWRDRPAASCSTSPSRPSAAW